MDEPAFLPEAVKEIRMTCYQSIMRFITSFFPRKCELIPISIGSPRPYYCIKPHVCDNNFLKSVFDLGPTSFSLTVPDAILIGI